MKRYNVTGMSCAVCQAHVEKAVSKVSGVKSCSVNLLTNSMTVSGSASPEQVIAAVKEAGYGASLQSDDSEDEDDGAEPENSPGEPPGLSHDDMSDNIPAGSTENSILKKRLIYSMVFLLILMYFSMGHSMLGLPLPIALAENHIAVTIIQMLLAAVVMIINGKFFTVGFKSLLKGMPNMDTLVAIGSMTSFLWSVAVLLKMTFYQQQGDIAALEAAAHDVYFESAAMIVALITVGKLLESLSKGKTKDALKSMMRLMPQTAVIEINGIEKRVNIKEIAVGDIFIVRPGESIPVDGIVTEGSTSVDESMLTGEGIPVDKGEKDKIYAGTINKYGFIKGKAVGVGRDTALSRIIKTVSDASAEKAPIAKVADKVSGIFVPAVIVIAVIVTLIWLLIGQTPAYSLSRGISVLVISCPCALGLATPVAVMVGSGVGAKNGILFKTAAAIEETARINIVALDKTGTVTRGEPVVTDVITAKGIRTSELIKLAYVLESKSEHPLAGAITEYCRQEFCKAESDCSLITGTECSRESDELTAQPAISCESDAARIKEAADKIINDTGRITDFEVLPGHGLRAHIGGDEVAAGSLSFAKEQAEIDEDIVAAAVKQSEQGKTPVVFTKNGSALGLLAIADEVKAESGQAVTELKNMGIKVVMITGDNERTASYIGKKAGIDDILSEVLPDGKAAEIKRLKKTGKVAMVGDGINDAPALVSADIGIAIGAGADVAIDAADIVLGSSRLTDVPAAIRLGRATLKNIHENLFWAFFYNILLIPLAAGAYVNLMHGWSMSPMLGAAAMSLSSFCVCMNALRLNFKKIYLDS